MNRTLWSRLSRALGAGVLALVCASAACAEGSASLLLDLPSVGRISRTVPALKAALTRAGLPVLEDSNGRSSGYPAAVLIYSGTRYDADELDALAGYVRAGGGVVYLFGSTSRHAGPAGDFLGGLGIDFELRATGRLAPEILEHAITQDVGGLPSTAYNAGMSGPGVAALARQKDGVVAAAAQVEAGRVVALPASMVTPTGGNEPSADQTRLLANACLWAAGMTVELGRAEASAPDLPPELDAPAEETSRSAAMTPTVNDRIPRPMAAVLQRTRHPATADFGGAIVVDILAGDDSWRLLAGTLDDALARTGLPVRYLATKDAASPLVDAVASRPRLLVVGAGRRFTTAEVIAVGQYVRLGGALIAIVHASVPYTIRIVDFNALLSEFGITASLLRPQGPSLLAEHAIADGLWLPPAMPWGVGLWSVRADAVAKAGRVSYMSAIEDGAGRVVALDGKTLLVGTPALRSPVKEPALPFVPLFESAVGWALGDG